MKDLFASAPSKLSNYQLLLTTRAMVVRTNEATAMLIAHLGEIDSRKLYLDQAQPSMFAWCVAELGCSEDVACNWIAVARASRRFPLVLDALREGKVHLTGLRMLAPHLTDAGQQALLEEAAGKSKREIEELIARIAPRPAVAASIRRLPASKAGSADETMEASLLVGQPAASGSVGFVSEARASPSTGAGASGRVVDSAGSTPEDTGARSTALAGSAREEPGAANRQRAHNRVEPLAEDAYKVTFTASRRVREKIRQAQDLLGHQVPSGDLAEIVERGLDLLIEDVRKKRFAAGRKPRSPKRKSAASESGAIPASEEPTAIETTRGASHDLGEVHEPREESAESVSKSDGPRSRYIPAEVRRAVHARDGEQCTFVDDRGKRCPEKRRLELDHADGFARGALHTVDGLRLRCRAHNLRSAEKMYGREFMEKKRAAKSSAPAREGRDTGGQSPPQAA